MSELWIGVTGFYATDNPHPGLAIMRALRRADPSWRILALVWDHVGTGAFADELIDAHARIPYPAAGPAPLLARLRKIRARHPLDVVIPSVDAEQPHYVALRAPLRRLGIRTCLPTLASLRLRQKVKLVALGRRAGVAVPEMIVMPTFEAVRRASSRCRYPQVLKGAVVDSVVVRSADELVVAATELAGQWGYPLLAQPLVEGEEYDVAAVARRGKLLGSAVMKKLGVTGKGTAWAGVTVEYPVLVDLTRRLVEALGWTGALEAEFIVGPDGRAVCFEVNSRLPSWVALAAEAGANLPAALVHMALGEEPEPLQARAGTLFARALVERVYVDNPLPRLNGRAVRSGLLVRTTAPMVSGGPPRSTPATVAVTGLNAADNPSPGLTVARSLKAMPDPPRLVGLTYEVLATGAYVPGLWDEVRVLPFPTRDESDYTEALIRECRAAGVDCLIPTMDIEVPIVAWLAPRLAAAGIATLVPSLESLRAVAKPRLPALAERGFRVPKTVMLGGIEELEDVARRLHLPFVLKGPVADARLVRTEIEARVIARRLIATWGASLIAQEYIGGQEFGVTAVAGRDHRLAGCVVVRKDIQTANGNTWGGTVVRDRTLEALAARFAAELDWVGPFELEVIRHPRRGPVLIEINPRFPGWVFLSAGAGANLPGAAVRLALGEPVAPLAPRPGSFYVRMAWDMTASVERMATLAVEGRVSNDVF